MSNDSRMKVVKVFYVRFKYFSEAKEFMNNYANDATLMAWPYLINTEHFIPYIVSVSTYGEYCKCTT